jgi:hypothetical protein
MLLDRRCRAIAGRFRNKSHKKTKMGACEYGAQCIPHQLDMIGILSAEGNNWERRMFWGEGVAETELVMAFQNTAKFDCILCHSKDSPGNKDKAQT